MRGCRRGRCVCDSPVFCCVDPDQFSHRVPVCCKRRHVRTWLSDPYVCPRKSLWFCHFPGICWIFFFLPAFYDIGWASAIVCQRVCFSSLWSFFLFLCNVADCRVLTCCQRKNSVGRNKSVRLHKHSLSLCTCRKMTNSNWGHIYLLMLLQWKSGWTQTTTLINVQPVLLHIVTDSVNTLHQTCIDSCYCGVLFLPVQFCF